MVSMRYIVDDVDDAVQFYTDRLGFIVQQRFGPAMAILERGELALWLAGPPSSARKVMADGRRPEPGGWNRFVLLVPDLPAMVTELQAHGVRFRGDIVAGPGGSQVLCEDPSGNVIELFQPNV